MSHKHAENVRYLCASLKPVFSPIIVIRGRRWTLAAPQPAAAHNSSTQWYSEPGSHSPHFQWLDPSHCHAPDCVGRCIPPDSAAYRNLILKDWCTSKG